MKRRENGEERRHEETIGGVVAVVEGRITKTYG